MFPYGPAATPVSDVLPLVGPSAGDTPVAVIDTNVVLDWLVFRDPTADALRDRIEAGGLRWVATAAMRDELGHVLYRREAAGRWRFDRDEVMAAWDRWAVVASEPVLPYALWSPRCTDPDDQKFIDLALSQVGGCWLLTRDSALLRLAPAARSRRVEILTPVRWGVVCGRAARDPAGYR